MPYFRASEGEEAFQRHVNLGAGWTLGTAVLAALGVIAASFWVGGARAGYFRYGLRLVGLLLVIQRLHFFLIVKLNAREEFRSAQIATMTVEIAGFAFTLLCVVLLAPIGMIWALLFAEVLASIYLAVKAGLPRLAYTLRPMFAMVREGFLLLCIALTELLMMTMDQIFLLRFFPMGEYGLYMLGVALSSLVVGVTSLFEVVLPRVMSLTGMGLDQEAKKVVASSLSLFGLVLAPGLGILAPVTALAVHSYLTRYQAGVGLYILMPLLALVRGPVMLLRPFFLARNQERRLITRQVIGLLTTVIIDSLVVFFRLGLIGVALASICGYGVTCILLIVYFEGSVANLVMGFKRYAMYAAAGLGLVGLYEVYSVRFAVQSHSVGILGLSMAALVYEMGMLAVIYLTRADWLAAL